MNYLSTEASGDLGYLDAEVSGGSAGGGATDVTAAVAGDFLARIKEAADAGYRLSIGLDSDGLPALFMGAGAAADLRIKRSATKALAIDDGAGGPITLNVLGTIEQNGGGILITPMTTSGDTLYEGGGTDVARTGTASSPTGTAGGSGTPDVTIDGNDATYWASGAEAVANITLNMDLGAAKSIASWRVLAAFALYGPNTLLESSVDNVNWITQDTYPTTGGADTGIRFLTFPVAARYWRIRNPTNSNNRLGVATWQLFDALVPTRLAKGTVGQVLTQGAIAPVWSNRFAIQPLDRSTITGLNATYGDDFDGASLNARWTRVVQASGEEAYQFGPRGSALRVTYNTGAATRYIYQAAPAGDWTFETSLTNWEAAATNQMFGLLALDASGNGVAVLLYDNPQGLYLANVTAGAYASALVSQNTPVEARGGRRVWLRLRKASGVYAASYSIDGENYGPEISGTPTAFTLARVGIGRILGTDATDVVDWHWFDKTA